MALRAFYMNPALGGFGGESTEVALNKWEGIDPTFSGDAMVQIVKELVENAIDACRVGSKRRVRLLIDRYEAASNESNAASTKIDNESTADELLRITVVDNGCGMESIQDCVASFHSSKVHFKQKCKSPNHKASAANKRDTNKDRTAGRYGVGLTCKSFSVACHAIY
jgi:HSP90 family molecular chaperone